LRNPSAAASQNTNLFLGFALAEAFGIFSLLIALLLLFVDGVGGSPTAAERAAAREQASITQTLAEVPSAPVE
jgi:hypothetical protein